MIPGTPSHEGAKRSPNQPPTRPASAERVEQEEFDAQVRHELNALVANLKISETEKENLAASLRWHLNKQDIHAFFDALAPFFPDVNPEDPGNALMNVFAERGYNNLIAHLFTLMPSEGINDVLADGKTALGQAVIKQQPLIVRELLKKGAHVNVFDRAGKTALYYALVSTKTDNQMTIIHMLISASGTSINDPITDDGTTPLHLTIQRNNPALVQQLLKISDIDVNQVHPDGYTPLLKALDMAIIKQRNLKETKTIDRENSIIISELEHEYKNSMAIVEELVIANTDLDKAGTKGMYAGITPQKVIEKFFPEYSTPAK